MQNAGTRVRFERVFIRYKTDIRESVRETERYSFSAFEGENGFMRHLCHIRICVLRPRAPSFCLGTGFCSLYAANLKPQHKKKHGKHKHAA